MSSEAGPDPIILEGHTRDVNIIAMAPDGSSLASGDDACAIRLWQLPEGTLRTVMHHPSGIIRALVYRSPTQLFSGGGDRIIRSWDVIQGVVLQEITGHEALVFSMAYAPTVDCLVSGDTSGVSEGFGELLCGLMISRLPWS